jgi:predicted O-linked N-acetylglucosamine transferase (SPINDLY family)
VWARVLRAVPRSRLELLAGEARGSAEVQQRDAAERGEHIVGLFARQGVEPGRVTAVPVRARAAYFNCLGSADMALDPFPYNGGVTTCDAFWMGVPVVSLAGQAYWSRQGAALLDQVGLGDLVARTPEEYVRVASDLALDGSRLAAIKASLRNRLLAAPVCDCAAFVRRLAEAYRSMWREWCRKEAVIETGG